MSAVAALVGPMAERKRGQILLVSSLIGHAMQRDLPALTAGRRALLAYGESLRFRMTARGVSVTTIVPGDLALRAAARYGQPSLAAMNPDRAARRVLEGIRRGRSVISIPCKATTAARMLRLAALTIRDRVRNRLSVNGPTVMEPEAELPWRRGSAPGD